MQCLRTAALQDLAGAFSEDMAARDFFDHTDPDGLSPGTGRTRRHQRPRRREHRPGTGGRGFGDGGLDEQPRPQGEHPELRLQDAGTTRSSTSLVSHAGEVTWQGTGIDIHHMGGASRGSPQDATAFPNLLGALLAQHLRLLAGPRRRRAPPYGLRPAAMPLAAARRAGRVVNFLGAEEGSTRQQRAAVVRGVHPPASRGGSRTLTGTCSAVTTTRPHCD